MGYFENFAGFMAMGGHGPYVWSCYAIALGVVLYNLITPLRANKRFQARWRRQLRRKAGGQA
jgi:heme exporter protein D